MRSKGKFGVSAVHVDNSEDMRVLVAEDDPGLRELLQSGLSERGVIVRAGTALGEEGRLRVTYGTRHENERFLGALDEVLASL